MAKFTRAKKFNKTNIKNIPDEKPIVYRVQNQKGKELYAGIAKRGRVQERLQEHLDLKSEKISGAAKVKIAQFSSIDKARKAEAGIIEDLKPKFNKQNK